MPAQPQHPLTATLAARLTPPLAARLGGSVLPPGRPGVSVVLALVLAVAGMAWPAPVSGQFGAVEALASRVSDLSFHFGTGAMTGGSALEANALGVRTFGVEMLFEVAQIPTAEARRRRAAWPDSTRARLDRMEVRRVEGRADTIYHYSVERVPAPTGPDDIVWTMEVGIGYGQLEGLRLRDPDLELNATVRYLPAVTVYLSYEPLGTYVGMRTGFMRTDALQVVNASGEVYRGRAEAFMMGGVAGYAFPVPPAYLFLEGGYTLRAFPSVEWTATPGPLEPGIPRRLDASGWTVALGIQFPVR
jgi:hypothetical protein